MIRQLKKTTDKFIIIVCYQPDALWQYWPSVGTFAMYVAICCKIYEKESNSVERSAKVVIECL